jgi:hypothetical protein
VCKRRKLKKIAKTDAIFKELKRVRENAMKSDNELLISSDAKAVVKIGKFSRNGESRVFTRGLDHDYSPDNKVTPVGLFLPQHDELSIAICTSKVTSDTYVDNLEQWWLENKNRFPKIDTLVLLQDNGPENSGRRTQFLNRMVNFVDEQKIKVRLAYYPPYHSKYNPVERCWGVLERHWNGSLLDSIETVRKFSESMTWKQKHPSVSLVTKTYKLGVKLSKKAMRVVEDRLERLSGLPSWFIDINYSSRTV